MSQYIFSTCHCLTLFLRFLQLKKNKAVVLREQLGNDLYVSWNLSNEGNPASLFEFYCYFYSAYIL